MLNPNENKGYVRVKVRNEDLDPAWFIRLDIIESFQGLVPSIVLEFQDPESKFLEVCQASDAVPVEIIFEEKEHYKFVCSTYDVASRVPFTEDIKIIRLRGLQKRIFELSGKVHQRSWSNRSASYVAEDITDFEDSVIEADKNVQNWIQPGWTNGQMLRYLAKRAVSAAGNVGGYIYSYTKNDRFIFASTDHLMKQRIKHDFDWLVDSHKDDLLHVILDYKAINSSFPVLSRGGYGFTVDYYDFDSGVFQEEAETPEDTNHATFSDTLPFINETDTNGRKLYAGYYTSGNQSEYNFKGITESEVLTRLLASQRLKIIVRGQKDISIGDVMNLYFHSQNKAQAALNGKWLIQSVNHTLREGAYLSAIMGCRESINVSDWESKYLAPSMKKE